MYNRYIPTWEGQPPQWAQPDPGHPLGQAEQPKSPPETGGLFGLGSLLSGGGIGQLLRRLGLERMDSGDLLLLLILLLLLTEGDQLEPAIALGMVVLLALLDDPPEQE